VERCNTKNPRTFEWEINRKKSGKRLEKGKHGLAGAKTSIPTKVLWKVWGRTGAPRPQKRWLLTGKAETLEA